MGDLGIRKRGGWDDGGKDGVGDGRMGDGD